MQNYLKSILPSFAVLFGVAIAFVVGATFYTHETLDRDKVQQFQSAKQAEDNNAEMLWLSERILEDEKRGIPAPWADGSTPPTHDPAWRAKIIKERGYDRYSQSENSN